MKHLLLIDNYDSFTYNLYQAFSALGSQVSVYYNDQINVAEAEKVKPTHLVISPGPGIPRDAGISTQMTLNFHKRIPVLGVCLGHQCIAEAFEAEITRAKVLMHGKTSLIHHDGKGVFGGLSNPLTATRYHSLIVKEQNLPGNLQVSAHTGR